MAKVETMFTLRRAYGKRTEKDLLFLEFNLRWGDDSLVVSFQIMLTKGSYNNFSCLHQKPPQSMRVKKFSVMGKQRLLKLTAIVSAPRPIPAFKNDIWHWISSNLFLKKQLKLV